MEDFQQLLEEHLNNNKLPNKGSIIDTQVIQITRDFIVVDIGSKKEATISKKEFIVMPKINDIISVYVEHSSSSNIMLSYQKAIKLANQKVLQDAFENQTPLKGIIKQHTNNGFIVSLLEWDAFLPISQLGIFVSNPEELPSFINKEFNFVILKLELNYIKSKIIISHKEILFKERDKATERFIAEHSVGDIFDGKIIKILEKSVLVEVAHNVVGLVRLGDISWNRIQQPEDVVSQNQQVKVKITDLNIEKKQIFLSIKLVNEISWDYIHNYFQEGQTVNACIVEIKNSFMILHIQGGIKGLLHQSNIDWLKPKINLHQNFKINQNIDVVISEMNMDKQQISFNLKQLLSNPWDTFAQDYPIGSSIKGKVVSKQDLFLILTLENQLTAILKKKDTSWNVQKQDLSPYKVGDEIECYVLFIDAEKSKIQCGLENPNANPWNNIESQYSVGSIFEGKVLSEDRNGFLLSSEHNVEIRLPFSQIPYHTQLTQDSLVKALITDIQPHKGFMKVSIKALNSQEEKSLLKEYMQNSENLEEPTFADILSNHLNKK